MLDIRLPIFYCFLIVFALVQAITVQTRKSLEFDQPEGWIEGIPRGPLRVAEFTLPKIRGDAEDASVVIFYFGQEGGSIDDNLERWISQIEQPDGRPSQEIAVSTTFEVKGLPVTVLDVHGTYIAPVRPGSSMRYNKKNFYLKAAVVETNNGPYFFKLTGPAQTVDHWATSFISLLKSVRFR
mgnify:CR=1 FL=1